MVTAEGTFPKVGNDPIYYTEANLLNGVMQVYAGGSFGASGVQEASYELTALTAAQLVAAKYVKISATMLITFATSNVGGTASYKIQVKETGGAYGDDMAYKVLDQYTNSSWAVNETVIEVKTVVWFHTLTAGDLANGCQFTLYAKTSATGVSIANVQVVVELC